MTFIRAAAISLSSPHEEERHSGKQTSSLHQREMGKRKQTYKYVYVCVYVYRGKQTSSLHERERDGKTETNI